MKISIDAPIQLSAGLVKQKLEEELPGRIEKGGWIQVGGGADDVDGPGFAYKLFLNRDAVRAHTVDGGFDVEVDITFDVDVRKRIRKKVIIETRPLLEGSTEDNRKATIRAQLRPTIGADYTLTTGLRIGEVKLHNPIKIQLKWFPLIEADYTNTVRDNLGAFLNGKAATVDAKLNKRLAIQEKLGAALTKLSSATRARIILSQVQATPIVKEDEHNIGMVVRVVASVVRFEADDEGDGARPTDNSPLNFPRLETIDRHVSSMLVELEAPVEAMTLLSRNLPAQLDVAGERRQLTLSKVSSAERTLTVDGTAGAPFTLTAEIAVSRDAQFLVLSTQSITTSDSALENALRLALPDALALDLDKQARLGVQRLKESMGQKLIEELQPRRVSFEIRDLASNESPKELTLVLRLGFTGHLELR